MPLFEFRGSINCSQETVFEFILSPDNLADISPPEVDMRILEGPERVSQGSRIEFEVAGFGQVRRGVHEITELEYPRRLVEHQVTGFLPMWIHEHLFEQSNNGSTLMIDRIEFQPPKGLVGRLITAERIRGHLEDVFAFRHAALRERLEDGS